MAIQRSKWRKQRFESLDEYVSDNSTDLTDPEGLCCTKEIEAQRQKLVNAYNDAVQQLSSGKSPALVLGQASCKYSSDLIMDDLQNDLSQAPCWKCELKSGTFFAKNSFCYNNRTSWLGSTVFAWTGGWINDHQWIECRAHNDETGADLDITCSEFFCHRSGWRNWRRSDMGF